MHKHGCNTEQMHDPDHSDQNSPITNNSQEWKHAQHVNQKKASNTIIS